MIAFIQSATEWGAVERYLVQILSGVEEDAVVIAPERAELEPLRELAELRRYDDTGSASLALVRITRELRALRPRLVHVVDAWPPAYLAARLARVPRTIVTHHTPELPRSDNLSGAVLWRLGWLTKPEAIYTSEADRDRDGRRGVVIQLGVDLARFGSVQPRVHEGTVIGTVARLAEQKGLGTLVAAAPRIIERIPDARFIVVGDGPLRAELEEQAAGLPFEFTGAREDVPELLAGFDIFALPSLYEGLCLAVLEAQAAGVPVVATPVGGIRDTVVDGATGLLVRPNDPTALADAVCRLAEDSALAARIVAQARPRVLERYSVERMVASTLALYG